MNVNGNENPNELVLDNRKLIIAFLLLIVTCGAFFLIGFMEGKRQGQRARADMETPPTAETRSPAHATLAPGQPASSPGEKPIDSSAIRSQLDWYGKVSAPDDKPVKEAARPKPAAAQEISADRAAVPVPARREPIPPAGSAALRYHVQVGAFRQSDQAKTQAAVLKAKGYACSVIPPLQAGELYLVRVGDFSSRTDAVAAQLRLKKDGFNSFVKTTK